MTNFLGKLLDLFFPPRCVSCKREGDFLCEGCQGKLQFKPIRPLSIHPSRLDFDYLDGVIYGLDYTENPEIQAMIKQFKYRYTRELAERFGHMLAAKLGELEMLRGSQALLMPVPLHKKRRALRGFNQAELIADSTKEFYGGRLRVLNLLQRIKNTSQQAKLKKEARTKNLRGAFRLAEGQPVPKDATLFLVDDVCTTGATLESCAKLLKENGASRVYGLVVARAFK